jgi:rhodanese-related sulfurtransferase
MRRRQTILGILVSLAMTMTLFSAVCWADDAPRISKEEVKALLGNPGVVILDARTSAAWKDSDKKIKGAIRIDPWNVDSWVATIPKDKKIIVYCS